VKRLLRRSLNTLAALGLGSACLPAVADPMKPLTAPPSTAQPASAEAGASIPADGAAAPRLSATRSDASGRWEALLGTRWLKRGDAIDGARVLEVDANRVLLLRDGRRETLFLLPTLQRAPAVPSSTRAVSATPF
jgi:hypothetical protein